MIVYFKYKMLRAQWAKLLIVNPELCFIALISIYRSESKLYITQIFRPEAIQRQYYPNDPDKKSVHQYWGGIDLGIHKLGLFKAGQVADDLNGEFVYDAGPPDIKTAVIHEIKVQNVGQGVHLHLQNKVRVYS